MKSSIHTQLRSAALAPVIRQNLLAAALLLVATQLPAQSVKYDRTPPGQGSSVTIEGTSSIHDWKMTSQIVLGSMEVDAKVQIDTAKEAIAGLDGDKLAAKVNVSIPVRSLRSYAAKMDEVYQQHMNAATNKNIEYYLKELTFKGPHKAGEPFNFESKGDLVVNAVTNAIAMPVKIETPAPDRLKISGTQPLKMTDYKVKPPNPNIGGVGITTGDEITVKFTWVLKKAEAK